MKPQTYPQPSPSPPSPPPPPVGTLWLLPHSPYSTFIRIVLHLSHRTAHERLFLPLLSIIPLRLRLGLSHLRTKLTAPVLRLPGPPAHYLLDSFRIASHIDSLRPPAHPSLFPPVHLPRILHFASVSATLLNFMRARLLQRLHAHPPLAERMYLPRPLRGWRLSRYLVRAAVWCMARKYRREGQMATRARVVQGLEEVRAALKEYEGARLRYVCGQRMTYADVVVAESLWFDAERGATELYRDDELADRFPDLLAWARAVRETHYGEVVKGGV